MTIMRGPPLYCTGGALPSISIQVLSSSATSVKTRVRQVEQSCLPRSACMIVMQHQRLCKRIL